MKIISLVLPAWSRLCWLEADDIRMNRILKSERHADSAEEGRLTNTQEKRRIRNMDKKYIKPSVTDISFAAKFGCTISHGHSGGF